MSNDDPRPAAAARERSAKRTNWPLALLALALLVLAGGAFYALHVLRSLPAQMAEQSKGVVREIGDLARGFKTGAVARRFQVFTTRLEGTNYLQIATLQQRQVFELQDDTAVLWGAVPLPPVVVRASCPVTYTYFVDLEGAWRFELRDRRVVVMAPPLRHNKPAIDVSQLRYQVIKGSLLRDEQAVLGQLRRELTGRTAIQARTNLPLVRATGRQQVERFVRTWLLQTYPDASQYEVDVYFTDEAAAFTEATKL